MKRRRIWTSFVLCVCLLVIIVDAKTAIAGASDGIKLCLHTVIPSLFPFFILSALLNAELLGSQLGFLRPVAKLCGIPKGAESLLILGLLGGYPVGAQCINEAYRIGAISRRCGLRMLGFCNNAGPAFIFGLGACLFQSPIITWTAWGIQIISAIIIGAILPRKDDTSVDMACYNHTTLPQALEKSIHITANVCGWVVTFRMLICFLSRWFLWMLPQQLQPLVAGLLELSNGCVSLSSVSSTGMRFILFNTMLSFGGICVSMQTLSAVKDIGVGLYFPGKVMQTCVAFLLSVGLQFMLNPSYERVAISPLIIVISILAFCCILFNTRKSKKTVAIRKEMLYNGQKC